MVTPLEKVSEQELKAIEYQINSCAEDTLQETVPYILREWDDKKRDLFNTVFKGESLILSRHVSFSKTVDQLTLEVDNLFNSTMPTGGKYFWRQFQNFCRERRERLWTNTSRWSIPRHHDDEEMKNRIQEEEEWYKCEKILFNETLAYNSIQEEFTIDLPKPDGTSRKYHVQKGSKPMRVLGRILRAYHFGDEEGYKQLCVWHSQILNDKKIEGELCLSIHPFDYMTMSENTCDWTSCMNWPEGGCYRGGTVEMMNSSMVIVAYLKAKEDMTVNLGWNSKDHTREYATWNSKRWRILIVVNEKGIFSVKGYPYAHKEMTQYCMEWIASLLPERHFSEAEKFKPYRSIHTKDGFYVSIYPRTYRMYNDYGSAEHYMMLDLDWIKNTKDDDDLFSLDISFNYSGASECMSCGALDYLDTHHTIYFDSEECLCCNDCNPNTQNVCHCELCGEGWGEDDMYYVGDSLVCPDCFRENCFEDAISYEYCFNDDGVEIEFVSSETGEVVPVGMISIFSVANYLVTCDKEIEKIIEEKGKLSIYTDDLNEVGKHAYTKFYNRLHSDWSTNVVEF